MHLPRPWRDRAGRFSWLKAIVFAATLVPAVLLAVALWRSFGPGGGTVAGVGGPALPGPALLGPALPGPALPGPALPGPAVGGPGLDPFLGALGPRPYTEAIHIAGDWTIRFLLLTLTVTPLRRFGRWSKLLSVRRMLGLATLFYVLVHLGLYIADQNFNLVNVASEIVKRIYLTIGIIAIFGLAALGVTSTDGMIRRMGRNWTRLHSLIYPIAALGLVHYFMQVKIDASIPAFYAGLFLFLMGLRLALKLGLPATLPTALLVAVLSGPATALAEALWYAAATGVDPWRVLAANLDPSVGLRPSAWVVIYAISGSLGAGALSYWFGRQQGPRGRARPAMAAG
ncbi:sulfite oxidase heme-binding subunit YedZ [Hartmannibacter diazotrophicus]|nr:ferric reductase-like transmembrane domain-containing protein [Hartmannibacter diazotrophicus]